MRLALHRFNRFYNYVIAITLRAIPVLVLGVIFAWLSVQLDTYNVKRAPAADYLTYSDFTVTNAREGEDVYFKVCRERDENYQYDGRLNIYIFRNAGERDESRVQVYGRPIAGTITDNCENKVIRAVDFKHSPGTYGMKFCVNFKVKYDIHKQVCEESNRYRIYPIPADLNAQREALEERIRQLDQLIKESEGANPQPDSLVVPPTTTQPSTNTQPGNGNANGSSSRGSPGRGEQGNTNRPNGVPIQVCLLDIGILKLLCSMVVPV